MRYVLETSINIIYTYINIQFIIINFLTSRRPVTGILVYYYKHSRL